MSVSPSVSHLSESLLMAFSPNGPTLCGFNVSMLAAWLCQTGGRSATLVQTDIHVSQQLLHGLPFQPEDES